MWLLNTILDIIFPAKCLWCGISGADLCEKCLLDCPEAERESEAWIFSLYDYRHPPIKKSIWWFKYKGKKRLAKIFAGILYERMLEELSDLSLLENFRGFLLIPIPLSPRRYRERGYNQAELICRELCDIDNHRSAKAKASANEEEKDVRNFKIETDVLIKTKETEHQARIKDRRLRLENLSGSFEVRNPEKIKNKNIILIDDVTTTGATLSEAKKTLKRAGAKKIIAFTLAH